MNRVKRYPVVFFFILVYILSWAVCGVPGPVYRPYC